MAVREYEEKVINSIKSGDLSQVKKCCIGKNDVNRPISYCKDIRVVSKYGGCPFPTIQSPTPLIYAILCEQDEILEYLLETKQPDLSKRVNGWAPIHFAACLSSSDCLRVLLRYEYIQENIDIPVETHLISQPGNITTALHIATTNRRHENVILLTQDLPTIVYDGTGKKIEGIEVIPHQPANPSQLTASGNAPLHIAARQNDWDMCQIILNASDDSTIKNQEGKTAEDIAIQFGFNELAQKLRDNQIESIESLKSRYIKQKPSNETKATSHNPNNNNRNNNSIRNNINNNSNTDNFNNENNNNFDGIGNSSEIMTKLNDLTKMVENLTKIVQQLGTRVSALENKNEVQESDEEEEWDSKQNILVQTCRRCGCATTKQCKECHCFYCSNCWSKPQHQCSCPSLK